ncbi:MAG TPA: hypothetical protein DEQ38_07965 [Elusimicrobia bacterium]|nr:MAG: hypothetical protein A2089_06175 [Elusimicrobia bacterium GWD2_63_28]HCC48031.1 hypothetical protein [Elusimicrobiota bacterium]
MKKRVGFTLVELVLAVFIFSYIAASMATIYSTTNRHMFQNYRRNVIKGNVMIAMRAIQNNLTVATRLDAPTPGNRGNVLAFATNVDQLTACYPLAAGVPAAWHYFCLANDPLIAGSRNLYYHTAQLPGGSSCGSAAPSFWNGVYPVPTCGAGIGGQTVTLLMRHVSPSADMGSVLFSRVNADGAVGVGSVRVLLRSFWQASSRGLGAAQRDVDFALDSVITMNRATN